MAPRNHDPTSRRIVDVMTTSTSHLRRGQRLLGYVLSAALVLVLAPTSTDAAGRYTVEVGGRGDWVAQTNFVQCVGASMQMMLNMIEPGQDRCGKYVLVLPYVPDRSLLSSRAR